MVVEHFRNNDPKRVAERFRRNSRMLADGLVYHASRVDPERARGLQLMETTDPNLLKQWSADGADLVDFEVVPVFSSQVCWSKFGETG